MTIPIRVSRRSAIGARVHDGESVIRDRLTRVRWSLLVFATLGIATLVTRLPGVVFSGMFDRDESYLSVMGDSLRSGGEMYITFIDRKPPIVPYIYAAVRSVGVDMRLVRLICALLIFANGVVVTLIVRKLVARRSAALAAGTLSVVGASLFLPVDAQAANFELWGLLPASAAMLFVVSSRADAQHAWRWFGLAGAALMLAVNCKQPYIVVVFPIAWEIFRQQRNWSRNLLAAMAGAAMAVVPLALIVDLGLMWRWVWTDNVDYLDGGISTVRALGVGLGLTAVFVGFHLPLFYGVWAGLTRRVRLDATMVVWGLASVLAIPIGLRFFGHYYQQLVPPLAVLSGIGLSVATRRAWRFVAGLTAALAFALVGLAFVHRPDLSNFTALGRYIQATTTTNERIVVWGALPDVYVSAERQPAGVFLHAGYLTGNWASRSTNLGPAVVASEPYSSRWRIFLEDIRTDPPTLIIDAARPGTDWSRYAPGSYPIGALMTRCYRFDAQIDGLPIWRLDNNACPGGLGVPDKSRDNRSDNRSDNRKDAAVDDQ